MCQFNTPLLIIISSKRIELWCTPSTLGFSKVRCKIHQQMIGCSGNLGGISESEAVSFQMATERNYMLFDDLACSGSEFQREWTATDEKARVPA